MVIHPSIHQRIESLSLVCSRRNGVLSLSHARTFFRLSRHMHPRTFHLLHTSLQKKSMQEERTRLPFLFFQSNNLRHTRPTTSLSAFISFSPVSSLIPPLFVSLCSFFLSFSTPTYLPITRLPSVPTPPLLSFCFLFFGACFLPSCCCFGCFVSFVDRNK